MKSEDYIISNLCTVQSYHLLGLCLCGVSSIFCACVYDCIWVYMMSKITSQ